MDEKVRRLNALQYLMTEINREILYKKSRRRWHEKDERAYWITMDMVRDLRKEIERAGLKHETLDF